jgi:hypothetical protein
MFVQVAHIELYLRRKNRGPDEKVDDPIPHASKVEIHLT